MLETVRPADGVALADAELLVAVDDLKLFPFTVPMVLNVLGEAEVTVAAEVELLEAEALDVADELDDADARMVELDGLLEMEVEDVSPVSVTVVLRFAVTAVLDPDEVCVEMVVVDGVGVHMQPYTVLVTTAEKMMVVVLTLVELLGVAACLLLIDDDVVVVFFVVVVLPSTRLSSSAALTAAFLSIAVPKAILRRWVENPKGWFGQCVQARSCTISSTWRGLGRQERKVPCPVS